MFSGFRHRVLRSSPSDDQGLSPPGPTQQGDSLSTQRAQFIRLIYIYIVSARAASNVLCICLRPGYVLFGYFGS